MITLGIDRVWGSDLDSWELWVDSADAMPSYHFRRIACGTPNAVIKLERDWDKTSDKRFIRGKYPDTYIVM